MPVLDGLAATETIRRLEAERGVPAVHIIALSASSSTEDMEQAYRSGVNDYGVWPVAFAHCIVGCAEHLRSISAASLPAPASPPAPVRSFLLLPVVCAVPKPIYPDVVRMALQRWADGRLPQREELEEDSDAV